VSKPLIILGSGGHAAVLLDILRQQNADVLALVSPDVNFSRRIFQGIKHYLNDDDVLVFSPDDVQLVNGLGSLPGSSIREEISIKFKALGYQFKTVVAESAIVSPYAELGFGVQVMAGAIIQVGAIIGNDTIVNSGSIIEHDCNIGEYNHIAPGATLSGDVVTGHSVHVGTGASVIQGITLANHVLVSAGVPVTRDIQAETTVFNARITTVKRKVN